MWKGMVYEIAVRQNKVSFWNDLRWDGVLQHGATRARLTDPDLRIGSYFLGWWALLLSHKSSYKGS